MRHSITTRQKQVRHCETLLVMWTEVLRSPLLEGFESRIQQVSITQEDVRAAEHILGQQRGHTILRVSFHPYFSVCSKVGEERPKVA